jgi:two-component system response regulator HydG
MDAKGRVLIVDDEPNALKVLSAVLSAGGYKVLESTNVDEASDLMRKEDVDAVITDLKMPDKDGNHLFEYIKENHSDIPVIFLTAFGTVESAVHAIKGGAFDFYIKPPDCTRLKENLARAVELRRLKKELGDLKSNFPSDNGLHVIGHTRTMRKMVETIKSVRDSESSVLVCGETGTGKELAARELHYSGKRKDGPFIAVNCAAIPRELLESELFGYERGAFTGAVSSRTGKFEEASGGTFFLDEVGELELSLQAKLLRVLETKEVERLGGNRRTKVDFRLVCSTNRNLEEEVRAGKFREDLFYRINIIKISTAPLRERVADIPPLVSAFVGEYCSREGKVLTVSEQVMEIFQNYHWPGNIRQLRNVVERAVVLARGSTISVRELPEELSSAAKEAAPDTFSRTLREMEIQAVKDALRNCIGNKSKAARMLGISRKAFYKRLYDMGGFNDNPPRSNNKAF